MYIILYIADKHRRLMYNTYNEALFTEWCDY